MTVEIVLTVVRTTARTLAAVTRVDETGVVIQTVTRVLSVG